MLHRYSRTELVIGREGVARLQAAHVAVFGIGGVGSYVVEALARAGIGRLTIVDFDDVCVTNLNRQLVALESTLGRPKVEVMAARVADIDPRCQVVAEKVFYTAERRDALLRDYSFVVDAIDTVEQKVDLIASCVERHLPVVACMGTGNKLDPTRFVVADIAKTHTCPLAKAVRLGLRARGIAKGVPCVFSTELPLPRRESDGDGDRDGVCPDRAEQELHGTMRRQIPGSISFVPPAAGLVLASVVVRSLIVWYDTPQVAPS